MSSNPPSLVEIDIPIPAVAYGNNANVADKSYLTVAHLIDAAGKGGLRRVREIIKSQKVNVNSNAATTEFPKGINALQISASNGHFTIVQCLIEAGAHPYFPFSGKLARDYALENNHTVIAHYLLTVMTSHKFLNTILDGGFAPLGSCIRCNWEQRAKDLIQFGADIYQIDNQGKTALIHAIERQNAVFVKELCKQDAAIADSGAIKVAMDKKYIPMLDCLLEANPKMVDAILPNGFTPLTQSLTVFDVAMCKYFLERGADVRKSDQNGNNPVSKALQIHSLEMVEIFVDKGAEIPTLLPISLFDHLAENCYILLYKYLLANGWNVNQKNDKGKTALALSADKGNVALSKMLIEHGADLTFAALEVSALQQRNPRFNAFVNDFRVKSTNPLAGSGQEEPQ